EVGTCEEENFCHEGKVESGSHNLVVGIHDSYTSYGGIVGGRRSGDFAPTSFVVGEGNVASGPSASVSGGGANIASGYRASVSGGEDNIASGVVGTSISGGRENKASGEDTWIGGGVKNGARIRFS